MRILVCGGRDYKDIKRVWHKLDQLTMEHGTFEIIEGDAPGADRHAKDYAYAEGLVLHTFSADWNTHHKAAGPIRNAQMLREGKPDLVLAFPGGHGTRDMVRKAMAAAVPVIEILERND